MNNLWKLNSHKHLIKVLDKNEFQHVMLILVTKFTTKATLCVIKSFLKSKAKIFPNVLFLLYTVTDDDMESNNRLNLIDAHDENYPIAYNIWDKQHILVKATVVNTLSILKEAFNEINKDYEEHRDNSI